MRYFKHWLFILLTVFIAEVAFNSCSKHYRYKKMIKRRHSAIKSHYHSPYQKKLKKNVIPINKNYIIRNKRNTAGTPGPGIKIR
jgi:hypothetical protein